jgi:hypothetical protein
MIRASAVRWTFALGVVLVGVAPGSTLAQPIEDAHNESGLLGHQLRPAEDIAGALFDLVVSKKEGKIVSVTVLDDAERSLTVEVAYAGVGKGRQLSAKAQLGDNDIAAIPDAGVYLTEPTGKARLTLALRTEVPEGSTFESDKLFVLIREAGDFQYDTAARFALPKRWSATIRPENVIVDATPVPILPIPDSEPTSSSATPIPVLIQPDIIRAIPRAALPAYAMPLESTRRSAAGPFVSLRHDIVSEVAIPPPVANLKPLGTIDQAVGLPKAVTDKNGRGPSNYPVPWFDKIRVAQGVSLTAAKLTTIDSTVYQDANAESGIFYYLPARFSVGWDPDNGHALRITYGTAVGDRQPVYLAARLSSGIDSGEVAMVRSLLQAQLRATDIHFTDLRPLPLKEAPVVSFKGELGQFDVPADKVAVTAMSDIASEFDVSLVTDPVTTAVLQTTLTEGLGLPGSVAIVAAGPDGFKRTIPATLRVPDVRSYPVIGWKRGTPIRNRTEFPLIVRNLHFLTIGPDGVPTVYSYAFTDVVVPSRARLRIRDDAVRGWLDRALKSWIEFAVREDDAAGRSKVQSDVIPPPQLSAQVSLSTLTLFAGNTLARLVVDVRSKYFHPRDHTLKIKTQQFQKDNEAATVGPVFLGDRSPDDVDRPGDPLFEYRLTAVRADGTTVGPGPWKIGSRLEIFFGQAQVQALMALN